MTRYELLDPAWRWQRLGGSGVVLIGGMAIIAAIVKALGWHGPYVSLLVVTAGVHAFTGWVLAFGSTGKKGIVGDLRSAQWGIVIYGASSIFIVLSVVAADSNAAQVVATVGGAIGGIALIVALLGISEMQIANRRSRRGPLWYVIATVVGAVIAYVLLQGLGIPQATAAVVPAVFAGVTQAYVGYSYMRNPVTEIATVTAASENLAE